MTPDNLSTFLNFVNNTKVLFALLFILVILSSLLPGCIASSPSLHAVKNDSSEDNRTITICDSLNRSVTFSSRPNRIITANQGAVPVLLILGAGDKIVGVPSFVKDDDILAQNLPNAEIFAGALTNVNCEQIIALKPDLIIEYIKYKPKCNGILEKSGIPIVYFNSFDVPEVCQNIRQLGLLVGNPDLASQYIEFVNSCNSVLSSGIASSSNRPLRVFMEYSTDYMAYGNGSKGDTVMNLLQVENIAHNLSEYPTITPEWIIKEDPDVIIKTVSSTALRDNSTTLDSAYAALVHRPGFSNLTAVEKGQVLVINNDLLMFTKQPAGILYLAKFLYPDTFSDLNPDAYLHDYADKFIPGADKIPTIFPAPEEYQLTKQESRSE